MIKITNEELLGLQTGIEKLTKLSEDEKQGVPFKTSYRVSRFVKSMKTPLTDYYTERLNFLEKYGKKEEDTDTYTFPDKEKREEFESKMKELLTIEIDLVNLFKFKFSELDKIPLSVKDFTSLEPILDNDMFEDELDQEPEDIEKPLEPEDTGSNQEH